LDRSFLEAECTANPKAAQLVPFAELVDQGGLTCRTEATSRTLNRDSRSLLRAGLPARRSMGASAGALLLDQAETLAVVREAPPEQAKGPIERLALAFPVACGLDPSEVSARAGAFFEKERGILQAAGFIVRRGGTVALAATAPARSAALSRPIASG